MPGWNGHFIVRAVRQEGVAADLLRQAQLRERAGGERLRLAPRGTARSLKKQYQARGVPPWQRAGPLVFGGNGTLLYVPGLGIDAAHWRAPGVRQLQLTWVPDPP